MTTKDQATTTPKPMSGTWVLSAPDGRRWLGESPLACVSLEQRERIPADVALERILKAAQPDKPTPDCRTCVKAWPTLNGCSHNCTNGDQYQAAPKVVLWRSE